MNEKNMVRCSNCGVELEGNANFCSLCEEPILEKTLGSEAIVKPDSELREEKLFSDYRRFTAFQKRKLFWSVSGLILISGIIATLLIDLIGNRAITWSKYPLTVSLVLYINITFYAFLFKKITLMLVLSFLSAAGLFV